MAKSKKQDELVFLPLGGSNEIGMNFNCYGFGPADDRKWIIVDVGVTFGDQSTPGVDIIMPDPSFIETYADDIIGIVLTHAHEDHIGAIGWLALSNREATPPVATTVMGRPYSALMRSIRPSIKAT